MFNIFKEKKKLVFESYTKGYNKAKNKTKDYYEKKINEIKKEVAILIKKKNDEIIWRDKYIDDIRRELDLHMDNLTEAKHIMQQVEQNKNLELLELAKKQQEIQKTIDQVVSIARRTKFNGVKKKIELYEIKKIGS